MAFKNEYIPPIEQETSEFAKKARKIFDVGGYSKYEAWTIDREQERVLVFRSSGREVESANQVSWSYLDISGKYSVLTDLVSSAELPNQEIAIKRSLRGFVSDQDVPVRSPEMIAFIKEAISEYSRAYLFNLDHFKQCHLVLIDAATGKEI